MITEKYEALRSKVSGLEEDYLKFTEKENSSAGTRFRAGLQEIKVLANELRKLVSEQKKAKKTKE